MPIGDNTFDFGIQNTSTISDDSALDHFWKDGDAGDVKPKKEEPKKEEPKKEEKKEEKKESAPDNKALEDIVLGKSDGEDESEEEEDKPNEQEEANEDEEDENQIESLSKELYKIGIFAPEKDEQGNEVSTVAHTPEELKTLFELNVDRRLDKRLNNFLVNEHGEEGLRTFEAIYVKGVDPREYFQAHSEIQDLSALDPTKEDDAELIIREFYKDFPHDKQTKLINRLKDISELQNQAEEFLPQLVSKKEKALAEKEAQAAARGVKAEQTKTAYRNAGVKVLQQKIKEKDFNGFPVTEELAKEAYDFLYNEKWEFNGQALTDFDVWVMESKKPENVSDRILLALLKKSDFDLSKIVKKTQSGKAETFFQNFAGKKSPKKKSDTTTPAKVESIWPI